jgi:hypothetical protein
LPGLRSPRRRAAERSRQQRNPESSSSVEKTHSAPESK